jgi:tellurite resistance-related uncharacterized protein
VARGGADGPVELACGHRGRPPSDRAVDEVDCPDCRRRLIPDRVTSGRRTPTFTAESVPPALLRDHRTTAWARLEVEAGTVVLVEDHPPWRAEARPDQPVVIVPDRPHRVVPSADAHFAVQFFDLDRVGRPEAERYPDLDADG